MKIEELDIEVEDVDDYNDAASDVLTEFCVELEGKEGMKRPIEEDDGEGMAEGFLYAWTDKASKLITTELDRLYAIGNKYFGETLDLDISSHMYKEL